MSTTLPDNYRLNYARYNHYYRQITKFYKKPIAVVSTALLLTIFTVIFFAVFAIRPTLVTIAELINTINTQKEVLEQLKRKSASLASAQQVTDNNRVALEALELAFPKDQEIQSLMQQVESVAAINNLLMTGFSVNQFAYSLETEVSEDPIPINFSLNLKGPYDAIKPFTEDIARMPRFMTFSSMGVTNVEAKNINTATNFDELTISVGATAFYHPVLLQ
jgi:Tfp pilus assembly protein PilO